MATAIVLCALVSAVGSIAYIKLVSIDPYRR
jgi:hypothetical protein